MCQKFVKGWLTFLSQSVESSVFRNGKLYTRRGTTGGDSSWHGYIDDRSHTRVSDARTLPLASQPTLHRNGFQLVNAPPQVDFLDSSVVVGKYYAECETLLLKQTSAKLVFAFDHNLRMGGEHPGGTKNMKQDIQRPIPVVHGDYTIVSAVERLRQLTKPPSVNDTYTSNLAEKCSLIEPRFAEAALQGNARFAIVNVWQNIKVGEVVMSNPLVCCDARSVKPKDLAVFEIHYPDRVGENYLSKAAEKHSWYMYSEMKSDEALLLKTWDSAGTLARTNGKRGDGEGMAEDASTFTLHSALDLDVADKDSLPPRWSIEVRCMVLY